MLKLAFCLFNYFPFGGLQRDFLRIAELCLKRKHDVHVYTMEWQGPRVEGLHLHIIEPKGWQNHTKCQNFAKEVKKILRAERYDLVVGFNKMPGLDVYYAADVCYQARIFEQRHWLYRLSSRYQQYLAFESAIFAKGSKTEILLISPLQAAEFQRFYQTEPARFHLLPPGIAKDRMRPTNALAIRQAIRNRHHLDDQSICLLMIGSGFKTKGVDRAINALAALPLHLRKRCQLFVIGDDKAAAFIKQARQLQILNQVHFLGGRSDIPDFLLAADILLHPAYHENTGTVLLEAMAAGLPALTTAVCGYATYIQEANSGMVLPLPFQQTNFNKALIQMLEADRAHWVAKGLQFSQENDLYSMPQKAVDWLEQFAKTGS